MTHAHDEIRVGTVCLPFIGNGRLMPWGEVVSNPLKAQRLAEEYREWGARGVADCRSKRAIHQNSLRAAMMVYLQMQESANVQDYPA